MEKLPVIFRTEPGDRKAGLVAIFPSVCEGYAGYHMGCYAHIGQHGSASLDYYRSETIPAKPEEYADLLQELRGIYERGEDPVELVIYRRMTPQHRAAFIREANRMANA